MGSVRGVDGLLTFNNSLKSEVEVERLLDMPMFDRISIDPDICHGQACIKGTRIPVYQIIGMLANGDTIDELLAEYPSLEKEDILACLKYAAVLTEEQLGYNDPIIDEVRKSRELILEKFNGDLNKFFEFIRNEEAKNPNRIQKTY